MSEATTQAALRALTPQALRALAEALDRASLAPPYNRHEIARRVPSPNVDSRPVFLDVLVAEAASVLCRRAEERRRGTPGDVLAALANLLPEIADHMGLRARPAPVERGLGRHARLRRPPQLQR